MFAYTKLMQAMSGAVAATADAFFNLVTLLLNTTATNGAQNNTFLDSSTNNFSITRNGNTTQGTFTPFSQAPGYWGNFLNGTDAYLTAPNNTAFAFGTGSLTIEMWVFPTAFADPRTLFDCGSGDGAGRILICYSNSSGNIRVRSNQVDFLVSTAPLVLNTWSHVAFVRNGSACALYFNGVNVTPSGSVTNAGNWSDGNCYIGRLNDGAAGYFSGYISNMRILKGTALYTSAFTPQTTPLTNITNTSILTCQSNRFVDNGTANAGSGFTITTNGTPSVQAFSPFLPTAAYDTSVVGGSGYFDGNLDSLSVSGTPNAAFQFSTGNFTMECWLYSPTGLGSAAGDNIFDTRDTNTVSTTSAGVNFFNTGYLNVYIGSENLGSSTPIPAGSWVHVALVRNGSTATLYQNGVSVVSSSAAGVSNDLSNGYYRTGSWSGDGSFKGYMTNHRVVKGTAVYTANFTPPTAPLTAITNTQLLLSGTNAGIFDSAAKNVLETLGNASVSTTQAKWGTTSMAFDGTGDYLSATPKIQSNAVQGGNATIEMWVYTSNSSSSLKCLVDTRSAQNTDTGFGIYQIANNVVIYGAGVKGNAASQLTGNTWVHLAVTRANTTNYVFIGGTLYNTFSYGNTLTSSNVTIASDVAGSNAFTGYIDDLRITNGVARYTANFVPTTTAFPLQ